MHITPNLLKNRIKIENLEKTMPQIVFDFRLISIFLQFFKYVKLTSRAVTFWAWGQ